MRSPTNKLPVFLFCYFVISIISCKEKNETPPADLIKKINLKRGELVSCGPADKEYGNVDFNISRSQKVKEDFKLAVSLLHSFEYEDAEKVFAKIIDEDPGCAMAYWGVAMSNYHPLWAAPTPFELEKGHAAVLIAHSIKQKTEKESAYIAAIGAFYDNWKNTPHPARASAFAKAMEQLHQKYPNDKEGTIFYALSLIASAEPTDKTYSKQKKAGKILDSLYAVDPQHPGTVHYLIHNYDYPELATAALDAARKYASIAPSSAHAQHMPSHVFTRMGLWDESIQSNLASVSAAKCYAENLSMKGHWDEELHGLDYLVYAYLQKGDTTNAKKYLDYLQTITRVEPENFKVAYAFAAIPSRYVLENKLWQQAATMQLHPSDFPWQKYPWQKSIFHFAKLMGNVNIGDLGNADKELKTMESLRDELINQKDTYKANQVQIQLLASKGWILFKQGNQKEGLKLMQQAADKEDSTQKHPVTPGEVLPARELLGDMLMQMNKQEDALLAYQKNLKSHSNRLNSMRGVEHASKRSSVSIVNDGYSSR